MAYLQNEKKEKNNGLVGDLIYRNVKVPMTRGKGRIGGGRISFASGLAGSESAGRRYGSAGRRRPSGKVLSISQDAGALGRGCRSSDESSRSSLRHWPSRGCLPSAHGS